MKGSIPMRVKEPSFVMIDGRRTAYDEVSPANPQGTVLLLTGLGSNRLGWYGQLEVFGRTYRTIALDYRDVGDSDPMSEPYTLADLADDAAAVLSTLGVQRAHVVGISMGGFVAQQSALRRPAGGSGEWPLPGAAHQRSQAHSLPQHRSHCDRRTCRGFHPRCPGISGEVEQA